MSDRYKTGSSAPEAAKRTLEQALGRRVRGLRKKLGLRGADFAASAGISTSLLSKIETGQISASLATLQALSRALGVPVAALFAEDDTSSDCSFVPAGQGVTIDRRGTRAGHRYQLLGHTLRGPVVVEPYLITLEEDAVPYTSFQHEGVELIYMLSGEVVYRHGERTYGLRPGDTLFFDARAPHGPETLVQLPMTYLSIITYLRD